MARRHIGLETKLAAALLQLGHIPYEHAKQMTARQICSLYEWDHWPIRVEAGGPDEPWNLTPRLIAEHREKTAKIDIPQAAKVKRLVEIRSVSDVSNSLDIAPRRPKRKIPSPVNPWPKRGTRKFANGKRK